MDFSASTLWWVGAGALVAAELLTGTFYLLMLALGCAAAAVAAWAGVGMTGQVFAAAAVGGGATAAWHFTRARAPRSAPVESNRDANLDVGQTVQVEAWAANGEARAQYRGAAWSVHFSGAGEPAPGAHVIVAVRGNRFDVQAAAPH